MFQNKNDNCAAEFNKLKIRKIRDLPSLENKNACSYKDLLTKNMGSRSQSMIKNDNSTCFSLLIGSTEPLRVNSQKYLHDPKTRLRHAKEENIIFNKFSHSPTP